MDAIMAEHRELIERNRTLIELPHAEFVPPVIRFNEGSEPPAEVIRFLDGFGVKMSAAMRDAIDWLR